MFAKDHIEIWIYQFLSINQPIFNNLPPCPYAKQALVANKVLVLENQEPEDYKDLLQKYEVIVYAYDPKSITADELYIKCTNITDTEIVALDDHPDNIEKVGDVVLNNGAYALILVQERYKLEHARRILKSKDYYAKWDSQYLSEVLGE